MKNENKMYVEEISKRVDISVGTLRRKSWRERKNFPMGKNGKELYSYPSMIDKWEEEVLNGKH